MPLNSVDLPAPFGPTTAISAPGLHRPVQMMHRRVAVIAEREIAEFERRAHDHIAQRTAPHSAAISTETAASRSSAERRRIDGETVAGGCAWPG